MKIEIIYFRNGDIFEYAMREIQALKLKGVHIIKKYSSSSDDKPSYFISVDGHRIPLVINEYVFRADPKRNDYEWLTMHTDGTYHHNDLGIINELVAERLMEIEEKIQDARDKNLKKAAKGFGTDWSCYFTYHYGTTFEDLDIEKIHINVAKKSVTIFWKCYNNTSQYGTKSYTTTVHRAEGTKDNIYSAVSAAFVKNKYKTNSQYKAMLRRKYGSDDDYIYNTIAMTELVEHFGSIKKVEEIVKERSEYIGLFDELSENSYARNAAEVNKALRKLGNELASIFLKKGK